MRVCLERRKMMEGSSCGNDEEERRIPNEESAMNIEIRDAALEARIKRQLQATGSASVEEVLARLLETQEEEDCWLLENRGAIQAKIRLGIEQLDRRAAGCLPGGPESKA
jgi:ribose 1,5-bisphosphokinase PhnN